ncbi:hypothetical protein CEXT_133761 [Caerostris extrusa]|uniref:Uncharacterized protein n=1 Tax=Caerostris extrusa TaxID=172846 RepID=A0AAV4TNW6_CAEEX|nr:hypothetical protein CEXT_133761 [Caerostris extrusa]
MFSGWGLRKWPPNEKCKINDEGYWAGEQFSGEAVGDRLEALSIIRGRGRETHLLMRSTLFCLAQESIPFVMTAVGFPFHLLLSNLPTDSRGKATKEIARNEMVAAVFLEDVSIFKLGCDTITQVFL